ncbi:hypothetical protein [Lysinibacillus sp. TE18511]
MSSSGWTYNDSSGSVVTSAVDTIKIVTKGTYYAQSQIQFYNGNGYTTYTSNATPNIQNFSAHIIPNKTYEVNENGLTHGSAF